MKFTADPSFKKIIEIIEREIEGVEINIDFCSNAKFWEFNKKKYLKYWEAYYDGLKRIRTVVQLHSMKRSD